VESAGKGLAEKDGEIEWLKKRLEETQAELESSMTEVGGLRRLNSARSRSVSSVGSGGTLAYPTSGGGRLPYSILLTQRRFPHLAQGLRRQHRGLQITGSSIGRRREVGTIPVSTGGGLSTFFIGNRLRKFVCIDSMVVIYISLFESYLGLGFVTSGDFDSVCHCLSDFRGVVFFCLIEFSRQYFKGLPGFSSTLQSNLKA